MEEREETGSGGEHYWLVRGDLTAMLQFVIKNIYVMASQYRASLISEKNTNINIYPPHWFW